MIARLRGSYFYFLVGLIFLILIFTIGSQRRETATDEPEEAAYLKTSNSTLGFADAGDGVEDVNLADVISCGDVTLEQEVYQRGNFVVFQNYIVAEKQFRCNESITLTSPGDYRFLDNVVPLVDRWRGPISVALYAPGYDFFTTLQSIAYLRTCETALIREYVTFHLFFEHDHFPKSEKPLISIYQDTFDCRFKPPYETKGDDEMYKARNHLTYPINVARNVAKLSAQTYFVFPSDIELYPTRNFIQKFLYFVKLHPDLVRKEQNNVFVLPIFEVLRDQKVPENKTQLQEMHKKKKAILFHRNVCPSCHKVPDGDNWLIAKETDGLEVFSVGKREGHQAIWEPFFVCTQKEPLWDERLNWEGQGNKMCQVYTMCMLNYKFMVMDNAFLIHKPGIKKKKVQVLKHMDQTRKNNKILIKIQDELQQIYGANKNCRAHNVRK
ncbi:hypothetical protein NQ318_006570 [Aromia moschata]|uniref:N-acetyllactosaminide beta-1,3-N-acetylglucosaminyltransferase n=1 Tax=Aromia moschata TaxID=1265417 RepID=A0AAV8YQP6_9CUCU|nr:hypothetical protein NQ318_006570 [Aromia moschata]